MVVASSMPSGVVKVVFDRGPQLKAANEQVERFEHRLADTDRLLSLPRAERLAGCNRTIFNACWEQSVVSHKKIGFGLALGTLFAGTAASVAVSMAAPQLGGLMALGTLLGTFWGMPHLYGGVVKKWILPRQMDPLVVSGLTAERGQLEQALKQAQAYKAQLETDISAQLQAAQAPPAPTIQVDPAFVVVNGMKIPVRK